MWHILLWKVENKIVSLANPNVGAEVGIQALSQNISFFNNIIVCGASQVQFVFNSI